MINWSRVAELRSDVGEDAFDEVIEIFLEEADAVMSRISTAGVTTEADMHFLKGCALNLGLDAFAQACSAAEKSLNGGGPPPDLPSLATDYASARAALLAGPARAA